MDKNENKEDLGINFAKLKSIIPLYYLPYDQIITIFKRNKTFMSLLKQNYTELEKEYSKYYNLETRQKLNNILPLLESSLSAFLSTFKPNKKLTLKDQLNNLCHNISYSQILNKIIRLNKILLFKYTIEDGAKYNFNQLISLIMFMNYPKEIILNIKNASLISEN